MQMRLGGRLGRRRFALTVTCDQRSGAQIASLGGAILRVLRHGAFLPALVATAAMLLLWQRCPSVLSLPSFWGEDGWVWYPACYADGWRCLLLDHSGYLQTISMLVALAAQPFPLLHAPKLFALAALVLQAAPAAFLVSRRMAPAIPRLGLRLLLAFLLIATPGMSEVFANLTNGQWHLALLCLLILMAAVPLGWSGRVFDSLVLLVGGLSGPFAVFLAPVAVLWWLLHRGRWVCWRMLLMLGTAAVQASLILLHQASRTERGGAGLGVSLRNLDTILLNTILGPGTFGWQAMKRNGWLAGQQGWLFGPGLWPLVLSTLLVLAALALAALALWRGGWALRCFLLFVTLEFMAGLVDGLPIGDMTLWHQLAVGVANRYSFHPILAWLAILVSLTVDRAWACRLAGGLLLACALLFAIPGDWALAPLPPTNFQAQARIFAKAPRGTVMTFQTRPIFYMTLMKK